MSAIGSIASTVLPSRLDGAGSLGAGASLRLDGQLPAGLRVGDRVSVDVLRSAAVPVLLDIEGAQVPAQLAGLKPGAQLTAVVKSLGNQPTLQLTDSVPLQITPRLPLAGQPGTALQATILQAADQPMQLAIQGKPIAAQLAALPAGTELNAQWPVAAQGTLEATVATSPQAAAMPRLVPGETVVAQVVQNKPGGPFQLMLKGVPVDVDAPGLTPGASLTVRVVAVSPQVVLEAPAQPASAAPKLMDLVRHGTLSQTGVGEQLGEAHAALQHAPVETPDGARLTQQLTSLLPGQDTPTAEQIRSLVEDGGQHYEAKLAQAVRDGGSPEALHRAAHNDLKGQLLRVLQDAAPQGNGTPLAGSLHQLLNHIESAQALNTLGKEQGAPLQLQVPIKTPTGFTTASLTVEANDHGRGARTADAAPGHRVFLTLDLAGLGTVRVDAYLTSNAARVLFYLEPAAVEQVQAALPEFNASLAQAGYANVLAAARPLTELTADQRTRAQALDAGLLPSLRMIDVQA